MRWKDTAFVYRLEYLVLGHFAAENIQQPEIKFPSDDGRGGQHLVALLRQPVKTLPDYPLTPSGIFSPSEVPMWPAVNSPLSDSSLMTSVMKNGLPSVWV